MFGDGQGTTDGVSLLRLASLWLEWKQGLGNELWRRGKPIHSANTHTNHQPPTLHTRAHDLSR